MQMLEIFGIQFLLSLLVFGLLAKWRLSPWLDRQTAADGLFWLILPHAFRHLGLVFLVPGVVSPSLPGTFAVAAGYGDLVAGILAIVALVALRQRWTLTIPLLWLFNVVGTVDLLNALTHTEVIAHLQSAWYIPTFVVPVLLVTHFMIFVRLLSPVRKTAFSADSAA